MNIQAWTFQIFQISYTKNVVKVHALDGKIVYHTG
nr:MAG TPA: hypothetical protein [Caudoviricetes sp.]